MSKKKRFDLISLDFKNSKLTLHDNLYKIDVEYTIYEVINLLNSVSQQEYDIKQLHEQLWESFRDISDKFNEIMENKNDKIQN